MTVEITEVEKAEGSIVDAVALLEKEEEPGLIEMEKAEDGSFHMVVDENKVWTEADVETLVAELEGSVVPSTESIEQFLDRADDDRDEWARITEDLYPEQYASGPTKPRVHRSTDRVQGWLAKEREER